MIIRSGKLEMAESLSYVIHVAPSLMFGLITRLGLILILVAVEYFEKLAPWILFESSASHCNISLTRCHASVWRWFITSVKTNNNLEFRENQYQKVKPVRNDKNGPQKLKMIIEMLFYSSQNITFHPLKKQIE